MDDFISNKFSLLQLVQKVKKKLFSITLYVYNRFHLKINNYVNLILFFKRMHVKVKLEYL
jgi:hypothetical protein